MRCRKIGAHALFEVYGAATMLPVGIFCGDHWASERARIRDAGGRTALQVLHGADQEQCCAEIDEPAESAK